jgi:hypothetical protein
MSRRKKNESAPFAIFEKTFEGIRTRFEIISIGSKTSKILVYKGNANEPIEIDIALNNHTISINGEKVANYLLCKKRPNRTIKSSRTKFGRKSSRRKSNNSKKDDEKVAIVQMDVVSKTEAIIKDTWFNRFKKFGKIFGKGLYQGTGWITWVITNTLSFLYYDILDWGPLSLPIAGFVIRFVFPSYSNYVEHSAIFIVSMINQPKQVLTSFFQKIFFSNMATIIPGMDKVVAVGNNIPLLSKEVAKDGTIVYDGTNYQIILKK